MRSTEGFQIPSLSWPRRRARAKHRGKRAKNDRVVVSRAAEDMHGGRQDVGEKPWQPSFIRTLAPLIILSDEYSALVPRPERAINLVHSLLLSCLVLPEISYWTSALPPIAVFSNIIHARRPRALLRIPRHKAATFPLLLSNLPFRPPLSNPPHQTFLFLSICRNARQQETRSLQAVGWRENGW